MIVGFVRFCCHVECCWELPWENNCGNGCWEEFHPMGGKRPMGAFFEIDNLASKRLALVQKFL